MESMVEMRRVFIQRLGFFIDAVDITSKVGGPHHVFESATSSGAIVQSFASPCEFVFVYRILASIKFRATGVHPNTVWGPEPFTLNDVPWRAPDKYKPKD
jgi:hypothetical protein